MITQQRTDQSPSDDSPKRPTSHRLVGDAGVRVGPMTRSYEIQHPGVVDHAVQVRSIAAKVGRHRAPGRTTTTSSRPAEHDTALLLLPRLFPNASAPLAGVR